MAKSNRTLPFKINENYQLLKKYWGNQYIPGIYICIFMLSLACRIVFFPAHTNDIIVFFGAWYTFIETHGIFHAFKYNFSDYNVPYLYLLAILASMHINNYIGVKIVSVIFDYVLVGFIYLLVRRHYPQKPYIALSAACTALFAPTIFINSAVWGQNDSIFTSWLIGGIYFLLQKKNYPSMICFALALVFKLQAIFVFPLLLILILNRTIKIHQVLIIPAIFVIVLLPAWAAGRNFFDLLTIYLHQSNEYHQLTLGAPNWYLWFPTQLDPRFYTILQDVGIILAISLVLITCFRVLKSHVILTTTTQLQLAIFFSMLIPFCLPEMHERYFYISDVLTLVYAFMRPQRAFVCICVTTASLIGYVHYMFNIWIADTNYIPFLLLICLYFIRKDIYQDLYHPTSTTTDELEDTDETDERKNTDETDGLKDTDETDELKNTYTK